MSTLRFTGKYEDYVQVINQKVIPVKVPIYEHVGPYITGYSGCKCHPFNSWKECDAAHRRKFNVGQVVKSRCSGITGEVQKVLGQGYYFVTEPIGFVHAANISPFIGQLKMFQ